MREFNVSVLPVWAPHGQWQGAGGSSILITDPSTGKPQRQYIGVLNALDVLVYLSETHEQGDACSVGKVTSVADDGGSSGSSGTSGGESTSSTCVDWLLDLPVSSIIGRSLEGLSCWSLPYQTRYAH